ncbi:hypothetical protein EJB05_21124 [Eragrostis curvula]|uniref:Galectin domain-containing protein n=1 Tax=Eragrostis curvula TaxID=38414 RepID=A0A5J9V208_9POAL|nr:hypothetical protein EJB05_21124 [Eragrostis curvula]
MTLDKIGSNMWMTKNLTITILLALFSLLIVRHLIVNNPAPGTSWHQFFHANPMEWLKSPLDEQEKTTAVVVALDATDASTSNSLDFVNSSPESFQWLDTWNQLNQLANITNGLPHASEAIRDARTAWENLTASVQTAISTQRQNERLCPYSIRKMNASKSETDTFTVDIPCGLIVGSSITLIGTPGSLSGNFWIDFIGTALPGEYEKPIVLHYNVRLNGDKITQDPVIVQSTFTASNGWGLEDRCPCTICDNSTEVDNLERCNEMVGREMNIVNTKRHPDAKKHDDPNIYFPFKQGYLAIATLRVGLEGIHMTVDGKHVTSFTYRMGLEPWFVTEVRISGDFKLVSAIASGLPTSEDLENSSVEMLKSSPIPDGKDVNLLIGIFSTANNFKRRMVIRRTWMQYDAVRQGVVAVRFFVGLHTNLMVNKELWNEAHTYGDIQVLPFVDYYSLITWKTLAICIYGTSAVSAKYLMKTDDDAFVRVDEIQSSMKKLNVSHGLLYGRINSDSSPHRNPKSKWYISREEWPEEKYPPWAHGPGYVVSQDIATTIKAWYKTSHLKMFKLEDVAMGIWINDMKKSGLTVRYESEGRIDTDGCKDGYIVAHYQEPRHMLCMWEKLLRTNEAACCNTN